MAWWSRLVAASGTVALVVALAPVGAHAAVSPLRRAVHHPLHTLPVAHSDLAHLNIGAASGTPGAHIPCDLANAYYLNGTPYNGTGITIGIVDYSDQPNIVTDLHAFDADTGLPDPPSFQVVKLGSPTRVTGWDGEITMDVEWAHALAPQAKLVLVETDDQNAFAGSSGTGMVQGMITAVSAPYNADVVSNSWGVGPLGTGDIAFMQSVDASLPTVNGNGTPVVYTASTGDNGFQGPQWPAISPLAVGVGGTSVAPAAFGYAGTAGSNTVSHSSGTTYGCSPTLPTGVNQVNETVWGNSATDPWTPVGTGTGGGAISGYGPAGSRSMPDVAMDADAASGGVSIVMDGAWNGFAYGGTSLAAPLWAGVVALLDQTRHNGHLASLSGNGWVYTAAAGDFNDIITGSSPHVSGDPCLAATTCVARAGYDEVTGRGSPRGSAILADVGAPVGGPFVPMAQPARVADTRYGSRGSTTCTATLGPGGQCTVTLAGDPAIAAPNLPIPSSALAVVLNLTVTNATQGTYVTAFPASSSLPNSSSINVYPGQTEANLVEVQVGPNASVRFYNSQGSVDLIIDVQGFISATGTGSGLFTATGPTRITDTRPQYQVGPKSTPLGPGQTMNVQVPGSPAAAVFNMTVTNSAAPGYLAAYPAGGLAGATSNVNYGAGQTIANRVMVATGTGGQITIYNGSGTTSVDVIVDLNGTFGAAGAKFYPTSPTRILDTRNSQPIAANSRIALASPIPSATALVGNFTVTNGTAASYIAVGVASSGPVSTSDINFIPFQVQANMGVPGSGSGTVYIYNAAGSVDVIADLAGWYAP